MIAVIRGVVKAQTLAVAVLLSASAVLAKPHDWRAGKVIGQTITSDTNGTAVVPVGGIIAAVPIRRVSNTVILEANGYRMTLVEKQNKHHLVLAENSETQFYQDGNWFVFQDLEKKEHKFSFVHLEKIVPPQ